jgi:hypothetical protein
LERALPALFPLLRNEKARIASPGFHFALSDGFPSGSALVDGHCGESVPAAAHCAAKRNPISFSSQATGKAKDRMRRFIIEREIPQIGSAARDALRAAAQKWNSVLAEPAPDIQWVESYVAADKTFCVYLAKDESIIRKHSEMNGFPASKITEVPKLIDPTTARA